MAHELNPLATKPGRPEPRDILAGTATTAAPATPGFVFLTIPAGRVWEGEVTISALTGTGVVTGPLILQVSTDGLGLGLNPADEAILFEGRVTAAVSTIADFGPIKLRVYAGDAAATLMLDGSGTWGTAPLVRATANGVLV